MHADLSELAQKTNYSRLDGRMQENRENPGHSGGRIYQENFKYGQKSQENPYVNTQFDYEAHYEPYYTYERHRIKRIRKENEFFDPRGNPCITKFFYFSTVILIVILLSSLLRLNMNRKSRKHYSFTKPLS